MQAVVSFFADGGLIVLVMIAALAGIYWLVTTKPPVGRLAPYVVMAGLTSLLVGKLASLLPLQSARPFLQHGTLPGAAYIDNPGFPSDHALLATVVVAAVYVLTPYKKTSYGLMVLAGLIVVARVVAEVHTPLDILGGVVAGVVGTVWYRSISKNIFYGTYTLDTPNS